MKTFLCSVITCLLLSDPGTCISTLNGFPTECGTPKISRIWKEEAMYSKTQATANGWPWHGGLRSANRGEHPFCGGTLISRKLILTSAHCIRSLITCDDMPHGETFNITAITGDTVTVYLGDHKFSNDASDRQTIQIELVQIHPDFKTKDKGTNVDVALLQLSKSVHISDKVNYICTPSADLALKSKHLCYYAGWGAVLRRGTSKQWKNPKLLREAEVAIADYQECSTAAVPVSAQITTCIEVEARSPCHGDAGGGLYCRPEGEKRWFLNGVLSNPDQKCLAERAITTSITAVLKWLSGNTFLKMP
uniref:Chymotrypsin-like elastase family member 2A n=1 Tax=Schistocephalus solidus TaxID=70667 RepID=A0A0X3NYH4_SCHSO